MPEPPRFPVIAIVLAAGGGEALARFLGHVPARSGAAFIVIPQPDPSGSGTAGLASPCGPGLPVRMITDGMALAMDHLHLAPPDRDLTFVQGVFRLDVPGDGPKPRSPLDGCLTSLAEDRQRFAVGVILSGAGGDGVIGLAAIRQHGGLTAVQEPTPASCGALARSAIDAGVADLVATAEALPGRILECLAPNGRRWRCDLSASDVGEVGLAQILGLLRERTGHDFTLYKQSTLYRRVDRRMGLRRIVDVADYIACLREEPDECARLFKELLIGVTRFFRDVEVWGQLCGQILPALIAARTDGAALRAWTPACATGEEAYSLAMGFREALDGIAPRRDVTMRIFATDLDARAIDHARRGVYPASIAATVSPERLRRFFIADERGYRVRNEIREMVIFAPHNLLADPPFTKLDVLTCRNLLIYLAPDVHQTLLQRFHFSLNPGGILLLGSSESVGAAISLFTPLTGCSHLYQRSDGPRLTAPSLALATAPLVPIAASHRSAPPMTEKIIADLQAMADTLLLQRYAPAAVLVDRCGDILHISGKTGRYLEPAPGKANWNVLAMARQGLSAAVSEAFYDAQRQQTAVTLTATHAGDDGAERSIDITAQPLTEPPAVRGMIMIVFADVTAPIHAAALDPSDRAARQSSRLLTMEQALQTTREEMQTTREEMQTSREELTSTNEELQSTNEELTTSAEELRTMNEELSRARAAAELGLARYADLFQSAPVGYFTLERSGVIAQANLAGLDLLGLSRDLPASGRLALFVTEADRPTFAACLERAFASREPQECEIALWHEVAPRIVRITALAVEDGRTCRVVAVDVTGIREAETAQRESEGRFRHLTDHAPVLIWMSGTDKRCTHFNQPWLEFTGRSLAQEIGDGWADGVHPDDRARCLDTYCAAFDARQKFVMEYRLRRHDGGYCWLLDTGIPRFDAGGAFLGYIGSCVDLTERMRTEAALKASEARYRLLWETTTDAVIVLDERSRVLYANPALKTVLGYEPDEVVGQDLSRLQPERLRSAHRTGVADYLATGRRKVDWRAAQTVALHRDGREIPVEIAFSHVAIDGVHQFAGFVRDVSERVEAESALRASEERYRRIVETANEGIWIIDAQARTTFVNPKMAQMLGYSPEEMLGRPLVDFMDDEGRAIAEANLVRRRQGITEQHDFRFRRKDGSELWSMLATNPLHETDGRYLGAMALVTDITERKRLEHELHQAQKMEAVGRLAGGIAHDFNNQLTVIQGYGALALSRSGDETLTKCLNHIVSASGRSADLVRQLLTFSRKGHRAVSAVDMHAMLGEMLEVLGRSLDKLIRLKPVLLAHDATIVGDAGLLQNAFLNLSLNARDAMPAGGDLCFASAIVDLDATRVARLGGIPPGVYLEIAVSDTGQGMSDEVQKHLFEPFFSTKAPGQGTGLGLASVYGTIALHGGAIEVDSAIGRGTTFRVYLPRAEAGQTRPAQPGAAPVPAALPGGRVLVIDDEPLVAGLVVDTLRARGYEVASKQDGILALDHFRDHWRAIDLVILDMNMPNRSGPETFAAMRSIDPLVKVLVMSGYSEEGGVDALLAQGAIGFIAKPFRPEAIALQVAECLGAKHRR